MIDSSKELQIYISEQRKTAGFKNRLFYLFLNRKYLCIGVTGGSCLYKGS